MPRRSVGFEPSAFPDRPSPWTGASLEDPLFLLSKVGARASKLLAEALKPLDLRPRHLAALRYVAACEGASQRDLVEGLWSDSSSVVTLLDDFEARGLAERQPHPTDRRAYAVFLTPAGYRVLEAASALSREVERTVLERLTARERSQLLEHLVKTVGGSPTSANRIAAPVTGRAQS